MTPATDLWKLSASQIANLVALRKVSATDVAQAAITRMDSVNPSLNAADANMRPELAVTTLPSGATRMYVYEGSTGSPSARLFRSEGPTGVQLRLTDLNEAPKVARELAQILGPGLEVRDWTRTNRNWFAAVQVEKRLMFIILTLIVAVAAFNLVSTLVMTVTDKRADIAILRTLGATPRSVMGIFMVQGAASGIIGTLGGTLLGLVVAYNIDVIVPAIERALHITFLPSSVYLISRMPSDPQQGDIVPIAVISLVLAFLATLYPSWSASRLQPAEALRYE